MLQASKPLFPPDAAPLTSASPEAGAFALQGSLVRVEVLKADAKPYAVMVKTPFFPAIQKNDLLQVTFEMRCLRSGASDGRGGFKAYLQVDKGSWESLGELGGSLPVGSAWQTYNVVGKAVKEFTEGVVNLVFHLASIAQVLEIRGLRGLNRGDVSPGVVPANPMVYIGREPGAPWRKEAERRIEKYRKGELKIQVLDSAGKPLSGAEVSVVLKRHSYAFGSFTDSKPATNDADSERYRKTMVQMFNRVTIPWYWADWGLESPKEYANYLKIAEWAQKSGFEIKAHCAIYPHFLPERVKKLSGPERRTEILRQAVQSAKEGEKYGVAVWDVLNELRDDASLEKEYGFGYYAEIFRAVRQGAKNPRLYLNEYGVEAVGGGYDASLALYEKQIAQLLKEGAPLEGIAIQAHFGEDAPAPESIWKALDRLAKFGLPIEIAEFDLTTRDDASQADYLRDFLMAAFAHPATNGVTLWGFWEGSMWKPEAALIRKDWTPRPAALAWNKLMATWTTRAAGRTDRQGAFSARGFFGAYEATVSHRGKTKTVPLTLAPGAKTVQISLK